MATRLERPRFFEGQYIGSADLEAVTAYARDLAREHALGAHSWGVATGLDLVEVEGESGGVDYFVLPGFGWDGYGRPIVLLEPKQVSPGKFAGLPSGDQTVWLRYDETPFRGLRPGFETCGIDEAYSRIRENVEIEVGAFTLSAREGGVEVAGVATDDARLAPRLFQDAAPDSADNTAPVLCDGAVPHQAFPADSARWLVPIGVATWLNGAPGSLQARSETSLKLSRTLRRMAGLVTEGLFAADGVIRLRDRFEQFQTGVPLDTLCAVHAITADDLVNAPDATDSDKTTPRLIGRELVWVEGNLRVTGQARLFGTRLELRDEAGDETDGAPLYARRAVSPNNLLAGQDFQIAIGEQSDGKHRFAVGPAASDYGDLDERFLVKSSGVFAFGTPIPADLKADTGLIAAAAGVTLGLAANAATTSKLAFQSLPALTDLAHLGFDDGAKLLRAGVGTDLAHFTYWTADGSVGIGTDALADAHGDADDLVVRKDGDVGLTLFGAENSRGSIHFADEAAVMAGGFIRYEHGSGKLKFGTSQTVQATLDAAGDLGIGTDSPSARIDIREAVSGKSLRLDAAAIRALDGGAATQIDLQSGGGGAIFHSGLAQSSRVAITGSGRLGIGTDTPSSMIHVVQSSPTIRVEASSGDATLVLASGSETQLFHTSDGSAHLHNSGYHSTIWYQNRFGINLGADLPSTYLHVRGSIDESAEQLTAHVALIENTSSGGSADVLALRIAGTAGDGHNFITFFDGSGPLGRIERSGTTAADNPTSGGSFLRLLSGGADFAECLPRRDAATPIGAGRVVGVRRGQVSLDTADADALMVTTDRAVVVGNAVRDAEVSEMVAFVGQVLVEVDGPVVSGDFILPSGRSDGAGRAVGPDSLSPADAGRVVGRAWSDLPEPGLGQVCVAVGVQGTDAQAALAAALVNQQRRIEALSEALARALPGRAG
jgi:hypothetical protein